MRGMADGVPCSHALLTYAMVELGIYEGNDTLELAGKRVLLSNYYSPPDSCPNVLCNTNTFASAIP